MNHVTVAGRLSPAFAESLEAWNQMPNMTFKIVTMASDKHGYFGQLPFHGLKPGGMAWTGVQKIKPGRFAECESEWRKVMTYMVRISQTQEPLLALLYVHVTELFG
jgi:hypothetical protein